MAVVVPPSMHAWLVVRANRTPSRRGAESDECTLERARALEEGHGKRQPLLLHATGSDRQRVSIMLRAAMAKRCAGDEGYSTARQARRQFALLTQGAQGCSGELHSAARASTIADPYSCVYRTALCCQAPPPPGRRVGCAPKVAKRTLQHISRAGEDAET